jgi:signal transduction histidine kinase/Fe-S-cluster-containing hydrogenase component 2/ActR/RegA family two-component response regulator
MTPYEPPPHGVVTTIEAKCRRCYNCVRSCPAKAIRVQAGQARIIEERCIGCGNCIRVCAQNAKQAQSAVGAVAGLLAEDRPTVAILAPSYPAAYRDVSAGQYVAAVRALGFEHVMEVGFGAEMVAEEYARILADPPDHPLISTPCPALVTYVRKYVPELVPNLAPVVSPMIALGRAVKRDYVPGAAVLFIGPCVAKKAEIHEPEVDDAIDAVITFRGLDEMFVARGIDPRKLEPSAPDPPLPRYGALFPMSGGLLKTAAIQADPLDDSIIIVEGPNSCRAALQELRDGAFSARFLDALLCKGCIAGPAFPEEVSPLYRRERVTAHVRSLATAAEELPERLARVASIEVRREFEAQPVTAAMPTETEIRDILARTNKIGPEDELNCGACGYASCRDKAVAVYEGLAEPEMCLPFLIEQMQVNLERLARSKGELEKTRELAARARQLASMGQLASEIAQQMSNPLGNIIVFAQLLRDALPEQDAQREDVATILAEALHCREVMSSLQEFGRQREPQWEQTHVSQIVERALAEVSLRSASPEVRVETDLAPDLPPIVADPSRLTQAVVNVLTNAFEAVKDAGIIRVTTRASDEEEPRAEIIISDNGPGVDPAILPRAFQPFVTTKARRGAGLGLAVAHGIVHAHGGDIRIDSKYGSGATVTILVPMDVAPAATAEGAKVLVVDDDPDFLEQERIMLEGMGFVVVTAERSDEALEVANREIPDAFVLDLMMERADSGARLARQLRRDPRFRRAPIVILTSVVSETGFEFSRNPKEVLEWMKADAWFDKPAPMAELANALRRHLDGSRARSADDAGTV